MPRLAWFAPADPHAGYARGELVRRIRQRHTVDAFAERPGPAAASTEPVRGAHDFLWCHRRDPYDLTVFEVADRREYDFVWPYLVRYPGLVLLHDARLHASRGASLLRQVRLDDYCAEFGFDHPGTPEDVPRLAAVGALGAARELWPMRRVVTDSARWLVVPGAWLASEVRAELAHDRLSVVEPGVPPPTRPRDRNAVRDRYGIPVDAVLLAARGEASRARLPQIAAALRRLDPEPRWHLVVCDPTTEGPSVDVLKGRIPEGRVTILGAGDGDTDELVSTTDIGLCLQWPDRSDGTWSWLEWLAAGVSTVVFDLADRIDLPTMDPRDGRPRTPRRPPGDERAAGAAAPVAMGIDIVDEPHSLVLALRRLVADPELRTRLGRAGQRLWQERFDLDRMADGVAAAVAAAVRAPADGVSSSSRPAHLRADGSAGARTLLRSLGRSLEELWTD